MYRVSKNVRITQGQSYTSLMDQIDNENRLVYAVVQPSIHEQLEPLLNRLILLQDEIVTLVFELERVYERTKVQR